GLLFLALQAQGHGELAAQRPEEGLTQSDTIGFRTTLNIETLKLLLDHGEDVAAITHAQGRIINSERDEIARIELYMEPLRVSIRHAQRIAVAREVPMYQGNELTIGNYGR